MKSDKQTDLPELHHRAEKRLRNQLPQSDHETRRLLHEFEIQRTELELQNAELRKSQAAHETTAALYTELYDFAPTSYFTLDRYGMITRTNLAGARLLGLERAQLPGTRFGMFVAEVDRPAFDAFLQQVFTAQPNQTCEVTLAKEIQPLATVQIEATLSTNSQECRAVVVDITEYKRAEEILKESEFKYRALIEYSNDAIFCVDQDGYYKFVNLAFSSAFNNTPEYFEGKSLWDVLPKEHADQLYEANKKVFQTGEVGSVEVVMPLPDKTLYYIAMINPIKDPQGNVILVLTHATDITARKQAEEALRESEALYQSLVDVLPQNICRKDLAGRFTFANRHFLEALHKPLDEILGKTDFYIHDRELAEQYRLDDQRIMETGQILETVEIHQNLGGPPTYVQAVKVPIRNVDGHITGVQIIFWDVTERKRADEALRASEEKFRATIEQSVDGIVIVDEQARIFEWSAAQTKIYGYTRDEMLGKPIWEYQYATLLDEQKTPALLDHLKAMALHATLADAPLTGEIREMHVQCKDGRRKTVQISSFPVTIANNRLYGAITRDITERKRIEEAEREQRALAVALRDTAAALNSTLRLDDVLDRILENVGRVVPHDAANIMLLEADGDTASIARSHGYVEHGVANIAAVMFSLAAMPILGQMARAGRPMAIPDTKANPTWFENPETQWVVSYAGAPIRIRQRTVGFLNLDSATTGFFNFDHAERLQAFADQAAIAIENARLFTEVQELAITDTLTGVSNWRGLFQLGEREVERALRFQHPLAVVMIDIDYFKRVNDTFGHPIGDRVLRSLAACCRAQVRDVDVLARYGGEEFILLLPETDLASATQVAERLRQSIEKLVVPAEPDQSIVGRSVQVTVSLGVVSLTSGTRTLTDLLTRVDQTMYAAKAAGRNRVAVGK